MNFIEEIKQKIRTDIPAKNICATIEKGLDTLSRYIDIDEFTTFCNEFNLKPDPEDGFAIGDPDDYFLDYEELLSIRSTRDIPIFNEPRYIILGFKTPLESKYPLYLDMTFDRYLNEKISLTLSIYKDSNTIVVSLTSDSIKELKKKLEEWIEKE